MGKLQTLDEYLAENEFLRETAEFHLRLEKILSNVQSLDLPAREKVLELVNADKIPLLQRDDFRKNFLDAVNETLTKKFPEQKISPELAEKLLQQDNHAVNEICASSELNETLTRKIFWATVDKLVPENLKRLERDDWSENFCPICGRRPVMAQLKKFNEGRARYLSCGACGTLWHWRRTSCPYCGCDDLEKIHIFEFDGKLTIRLDVCDECGAYLKTYGEEDAENIYLRDWATLHLDLLAEEKNLRKCGAVELE
ncbi:MAG: formate dehydrogenase accessory protein FdhE [Selenomonadaceae bacterium]|nr:formate dehydrogenase accessory protein FdhE [Selenomonadaceae bacterium]